MPSPQPDDPAVGHHTPSSASCASSSSGWLDQRQPLWPGYRPL